MDNVITTFRQLYVICKQKNQQIFETAIENEVAQGEYTEYQIRMQAKKSLDAMKSAINSGLKSTEPSQVN